jgi:hypothetical protein
MVAPPRIHTIDWVLLFLFNGDGTCQPIRAGKTSEMSSSQAREIWKSTVSHREMIYSKLYIGLHLLHNLLEGAGKTWLFAITPACLSNGLLLCASARAESEPADPV